MIILVILAPFGFLIPLSVYGYFTEVRTFECYRSALIRRLTEEKEPKAVSEA